MKNIKIYKEKLEEELQILEEELSKIGVKNPSNPSDWIPKTPEENNSLADENDVADTVDEGVAVPGGASTCLNHLLPCLQLQSHSPIY